MTPTRFAPFFLLALATLSPKASAAPDQSSALLRKHPSWTLVAWTRDGARTEAMPDITTLGFTTRRKFGGNAGVNSYSGTVKAGNDGSLRPGTTAVTEMAGDPALMAQENHYLQVLATVSRFTVTHQTLILSDGTAANQLHFIPTHVPKAMPLVGTTWTLTAMEAIDRQSISSTALVEGTSITLLLSDVGRASGSSGVNRYFGPAKPGPDHTITIDRLASTRRAGPPAAMQQESAYLEALQSMRTFTITGSRLTLSNADRTRRLQFEAASP